jgi:two-component system, sensor histidine kinase PhcS
MTFIPSIPPELRAAYREEDRDKTIRKTQWGCIFGIVLVPLFGLLDFYVFDRDTAFSFLRLRLLCSALMAGLYPILTTRFGRKFCHFQGIILLFLPSATITYMVYATDGAASPYYAGLTLVLMVLAVVLDWPFWQSVVSVGLVLLLYTAACWFAPAAFDQTLFVNNLFFLVSSSLAIIAGTYFHSGVRIREFVSRSELDASRKALEASLVQLKENEAQLVQSEKLASLGRMSAGIIHEINNPLNFATTGLFTLRKKGRHLAPEQQADYAEVITDVEEGLKRVQTIVSDLRLFTHPNTEQLEKVKVSEVVTQALRFMSNEWRGAAQVEQKLAEGQIIQANKNKLIQVLVNLLQNSLDAVKEKTYANGEKPTVWIEGRVENGLSILAVRDNGGGIDTKHLDKIFDPFFTTKDVGAGMGLGLSICYRIMQESGGKISVRTEPGKFCEFALEFPVKDQQANS